MEIIVNRVYRHFKNDYYLVVGIAQDSESDKQFVIYRCLYGEGKLYAREKSMFLSKVDKQKYPDATQEYRFVLVDIASQNEHFNKGIK